jgi:hypothetical protein
LARSGLRSTYRPTGSGWTVQNPQGQPVTSFALGYFDNNDYLVALTSSGDLYTSVGCGWVLQNTSVNSFTLRNGQLTIVR